MGYIIFWTGLAILVSAGLALTAWIAVLAIDYAWRRVKDAHNLAVLIKELRRLRKEGRLWGYDAEGGA